MSGKLVVAWTFHLALMVISPSHIASPLFFQRSSISYFVREVDTLRLLMEWIRFRSLMRITLSFTLSTLTVMSGTPWLNVRGSMKAYPLKLMFGRRSGRFTMTVSARTLSPAASRNPSLRVTS